MTAKHLLLVGAMGIAVAGAGSAMRAQQAPQGPGSDWSLPANAPENAALRSLRWRGIGPANPGGRIAVVAGIPGKPETFYVAGAAGGIIKTTNGGTTWTPIFDDQVVASIGAMSQPRVATISTGTSGAGGPVHSGRMSTGESAGPAIVPPRSKR